MRTMARIWKAVFTVGLCAMSITMVLLLVNIPHKSDLELLRKLSALANNKMQTKNRIQNGMKKTRAKIGEVDHLSPTELSPVQQLSRVQRNEKEIKMLKKLMKRKNADHTKYSKKLVENSESNSNLRYVKKKTSVIESPNSSEYSSKMEWVDITDDENHELYILSAFWDDRWEDYEDPTISINIMVSSQRVFLYSIVICEGNPKPEVMRLNLRDLSNENYVNSFNDVEYQKFIVKTKVSCGEPLRATLSFTPNLEGFSIEKTVPVEYPLKQQEHDFTICVPPLFDCLNPYMVAEWFEMQKILGVSKIVVHNHTQCEETSKVIRAYAREGLVDIRQDSHLMETNGGRGARSEIRLRSSAMMTDCLYRHMHDSKYVISLDFDELLLPSVSYSLTEMMDDVVSTYNANYVGQYTFGTYMFITDSDRNVTDLLKYYPVDETYPETSTFFRFRYRLSETPDLGKSILVPHGCLGITKHDLSVEISQLKIDVPKHSQVLVHSELGKVHRYRKGPCKFLRGGSTIEDVYCVNDTPPLPVFEDETILKYKRELMPNLERRLQLLDIHYTPPPLRLEHD